MSAHDDKWESLFRDSMEEVGLAYLPPEWRMGLWKQALEKFAAKVSAVSHVAQNPAPVSTLDETLSAEDQKALDEGRKAARETFGNFGDMLRAASAPSTTAEKQAAVETIEQALLEMHHSYTSPEWFTKGDAGAAAQFRLWHGRGLEAIRVLKRETTASATACSEAERYRWIRKNAVWRAGYREQSVTWDLYMREPDIRAGKLTDDSVAQELDAAIDSAMRAADGGKQT